MTTQTDKSQSMDRTVAGFDSKFRFVLLASHRAEQLKRGARPKLELDEKEKPSRVAIEELCHEMIEWDYGPAPQPELELAEGEEAGLEMAADPAPTPEI